MKKKLISIFTIVCMLTAFMPTLAFAFDGDDANPDDSNTEIVLNAEGIELSGGQESDGDVVLDSASTVHPSGPVVDDGNSSPVFFNLNFVDKNGSVVKRIEWNEFRLKDNSKEAFNFPNDLGLTMNAWNNFVLPNVPEGYEIVGTFKDDYLTAGLLWYEGWVDGVWHEYGDRYELNVKVKVIEKTSKITLNCVDTKGNAIADPTSVEVLARDEVKIVAPDLKIKGYVPTGDYKEDGLVANRVGENRYALQVEEGVDGSFTIVYDKTKTEQLYLRVVVDGKEQGTTLIYEGEKNNGASLSTKYADREEAIRTGLYDRLNNKYAETDVHCNVENGVVKFNWIHHADSNGHNPEKMSSDYQLTIGGKKIKSSNVDIDYQESGTDQFDIHIFTATIDTSKLVDVIVHYVDEEGNEIADSEALTGYEDEDFDPDTINIKDIEDYENPEVGEVPEKYPSEGSVDVYIEYKKAPRYVVTYTDGVASAEVFRDQVYSELKKGVNTPAFEGTPERAGYIFSGWAPEVSETVTGNATYVAQWRPDKVPYDVEYYYQKDGKYAEPDKVIKHLGDTGTEATLTSRDIIPEKDGYVLDKDNKNTVKAAEIKADGSTVLRVYFEEQFNVIIHYVNKETGYEVVEARYENTMKWGDELDVLSPVPPTGYKFEDSADARIQRIITDDFERWVYYVPIEYNVVIHYVDEDGNMLAEDYMDAVRYGKSFEKVSPEVEGYELVNSADSTVGREDVRDNFEYTVVYKAVENDTPDTPNTPVTPTYNDPDHPNTADPFHLFVWGMLFVAAGIGIYVTKKFRA